jgi:hypothetical protein
MTIRMTINQIRHLGMDNLTRPIPARCRYATLAARNDYSGERMPSRLARTIHACRREAFETEVPRGFSHVRPTQAYLQSVEEAEREQPRRARGSDDAVGIHE